MIYYHCRWSKRESRKLFVNIGDLKKKIHAYNTTILPHHLSNFKRQLKLKEGGYFIGDSLTLADVACYPVVHFSLDRFPRSLDSYPELEAWKGRVESNEGIKKYLASDEYAGLMKMGIGK